MPNIFLKKVTTAADTAVITTTANVYGYAGGDEEITIAPVSGVFPTNIVVAQTIEKVTLTGAMSDFQFAKSGTTDVLVYHNATLIATIRPQTDDDAGADGTILAFTAGATTETTLKVISAASIQIGGINLTTTPATYDADAPTLALRAPADDEIGVPVDTNLTLTFSEAVTAVALKNIVIRKTSDDSVVATIAADSGQVTIAGAVVTINPSADLDVGTDYYLQIDAGAFEDGAGNAYAGLTSTTALNFTTNAHTFTVTNNSDVVSFDGTSSGAITLAITAGTGSFTRQGVLAATTVANVMTATIEGGTADDTLQLSSSVTALTFDAKAGNDKLVLADADNTATLTLTAVESVDGGTGNDVLTLANTVTALTLDGKAGNDKLVLVDAGNTATLTLTAVESVDGGTGADVLTLANTVATLAFDGKAGNDKLILTDAGNTASLSLTAVESIDGGTGADVLTLTAAASGLVIDAKAGSDSVTFANVANSATLTNVESIYGGTLNDTITLGATTTTLTFDGGAGTDSLTTANGANSVTLTAVESITGGTGADRFTFTSQVSGVFVDGRAGTDSLYLADAINTVTVTAVETIVAGTSDDTITLQSLLTLTNNINAGTGNDRLILAAGVNSATLTGFEWIDGSTSADTLTLRTAVSGLVFDGKAGSDAVVLANGGNVISLTNTEKVTGGTGADSVTFQESITGVSCDLAGGIDKLYLADTGVTISFASFANTEYLYGGTGNDSVSFGGNNAITTTLTDVESVTGSTLNDTITMGVAITALTFDGNTGSDKLALAATGNTATLTLTSVESIDGAAGDDVLTLANAVTAMTFDGRAGNDKLVLADGGGTTALTLTAVESVTGGTGDDVITITSTTGVIITGGEGADTLTGGSGLDTFVYTSVSNATSALEVITNFTSGESIKTGTAADNTNMAKVAAADYGASQPSLATLLTAANNSLSALSGAASTRYALLADGTTDAANGGASAIATANSYLFIDWDGDGTADQVIKLSGWTDVTTFDVNWITA